MWVRRPAKTHSGESSLACCPPRSAPSSIRPGLDPAAEASPCWIKAFFKFEYPARVFIGDELRCRDNRRQIDVSLNLPDLLAHLPRGLDTRLGRSFDDGAGLSFGQWQRLALRRALVKDAALLILDEPSSFLDTATAAALRTIVADRQDQAILVATHDPAVASIADRVVRLEGGRVVV